jgi:hypothetical protein
MVLTFLNLGAHGPLLWHACHARKPASSAGREHVARAGLMCGSDRDGADWVATNCCVGDNASALYAGRECCSVSGSLGAECRVPSAMVCL